MKRSSTAIWEGTGKEGKGRLSASSGVLTNTPYAYATRFEMNPGTNPEELIAAAHAGCFSMKLAFNITKAGFTPEKIETICDVTFDPAKGEITTSELRVSAKAGGMDQHKFLELAEDAKTNCPVSRVLKCELKLSATLG
jgi:lipoyl-dependent peroxiredoxin